MSLPDWHTLIQDLGYPPVKRLARVLGISKRSVYRYQRENNAPRAVLFSLFWLSSWGRAWVNDMAVRDAQMAVGYVDALRRRVSELERQVAYLVELGNSGAANDPL